MARSTAFITSGVPGVGKTYVRGAYYVAMEWIPYHDGLHVSNFPLDVDAIAAFCKKRHGIDEEDTRRRIVLVPREEVQSWTVEGGSRGPWSWFRESGTTLSGTHFALDEAHVFCARGDKPNIERRKLFRQWIREIRHEGCTVEFLTQTLDLMDDDLVKAMGLRMNIVSRVTDRDPFFRIPMVDWYELKGWITGEWNPYSSQHEYRRSDKKWEEISVKLVELNSTFYKLYNSFSAAQSEKTSVSSEEVHRDRHEFEKRSLPGLLWWFWRRNYGPLCTRALLLLVFGWVTVGGGAVYIIGAFMGLMGSFVPGADASASADTEEVAVVGSAEGLPGSAEGEPVEVSDLPGFQEQFALDTVIFVHGETGEEYSVGDYLDLIQDRAWLETTVEVQGEELESLRAQESEVVVLSPAYVVFDTGQMVPLGGAIRGTTYDGQTVRSINYKDRQVELSGGAVLSLRVRDDSRQRRRRGGLSGGGGLSGHEGHGHHGAGSEGGGSDAGGRRDTGRAVSASDGSGNGV